MDQWSIPKSHLKRQKNTMQYEKTTCRSLSQDYQPIHPARLQVHQTTSLQQDVVDPTLRPAITRSHSTSSRELGDQFRESTKFKNTCKDEDIDRAQGDLLRALSDWLEEFTKKSRGRKTSIFKGHSRNLFSRMTSRTCWRTAIGQAQYLYSLPEGRRALKYAKITQIIRAHGI